MATMEFREGDEKIWFIREGVDAEPEPVKIAIFKKPRK
jgi:hypothetical protein